MDPVDRRILRLLQADGKLSFQDLGDAVGLSAPATFQRVKKLEAAGVILGYHAKVDASSVGLAVVGFLDVVPKSGEDDVTLRRRWRDTPGVLECHRLSGDVGYRLKVRARSLRELGDLANALRRSGCVVRLQLALETEFERWTVES